MLLLLTEIVLVVVDLVWVLEFAVVLLPLRVGAPSMVNSRQNTHGMTGGGHGWPFSALLSSVVQVPLFINQGEVIRVDTRSASYVSRAKG